MNRMLLGSFLLLASAGAGIAEDQRPVRVIAITREAADASAAAIAKAKNPTLGARVSARPLAQTRIEADASRSERRDRYAARERAREVRNIREARAEAVETPPVEQRRPMRRVEVISPTAFGHLAVRVYEVYSGR